jgi:hypothetical protein
MSDLRSATNVAGISLSLALFGSAALGDPLPGGNAAVIVLVWDENDFSNAPNRFILLVETNYAPNGRVDDQPYDHYSLLGRLEAGFGLSCLNHACDATSKVINDLFGG